NIGGVFRRGAADVFAHCSTPSAFRIVTNFIVVSGTAELGVVWRPAPATRPVHSRRKATRPTLLGRNLPAAPFGPRVRLCRAPAPRRQPECLAARKVPTAFGLCSPGCDCLREAGQSERSELSDAMLEPAHGDRACEHPKAAALDER